MSEVTILSEAFYKPIKSKFINISNEKTFRSEISFAIQILKKNTYLQKCDANSVLESVLNISQTGLSLNPVLNLSYLVPHKGKCALYPSYQGLCKLATDSGAVNSIECQLIYTNDEIEFDLASAEKVKKHIPAFLVGKEKGEVLGGYSIAVLPDGSKHIEYMTRADILEVRNCSESYKAYERGQVKHSVWASFESEMMRKTIVKRHFKYLPKSSVSDKFEKAIELDNSDYDFPMTYEQGNMIESLLKTSSIPQKYEDEIYDNLMNDGFTQKRASECIEYLQDNQLDPITSGNGNYMQGDIQKKLTQIKENDARTA
jgi:phage RecT family recombinase